MEFIICDRLRIANKFHMKSVEQKKSRFVRKCQNKNAGCIINKSANKWKPGKEDVKRSLFINLNVRKCQHKSVKQHMQRGAKKNIKKSKDIKMSIDVCGLRQNKTNIAHKHIIFYLS